jgi:NAD-dependent SIR2 family protein deacetylase
MFWRLPSLPLIAKQNGAVLVEVNTELTPLSDYVDLSLRQPAAQALPQWWQRQMESLNDLSAG